MVDLLHEKLNEVSLEIEADIKRKLITLASNDPWWECVYCGKKHKSPNGNGTDIACCGEIGHVEISEDQSD